MPGGRNGAPRRGRADAGRCECSDASAGDERARAVRERGLHRSGLRLSAAPAARAAPAPGPGSIAIRAAVTLTDVTRARHAAILTLKGVPSNAHTLAVGCRAVVQRDDEITEGVTAWVIGRPCRTAPGTKWARFVAREELGAAMLVHALIAKGRNIADETNIFAPNCTAGSARATAAGASAGGAAACRRSRRATGCEGKAAGGKEKQGKTELVSSHGASSIALAAGITITIDAGITIDRMRKASALTFRIKTRS